MNKKNWLIIGVIVLVSFVFLVYVGNLKDISQLDDESYKTAEEEIG